MWLIRSLLLASLVALVPSLLHAEGPAPSPLSAAALAGRIDAFLESALSAKGVEPAPLASDAEFHRRVYLDLAGRIPTAAETRAFLRETSPDRRAKLVEELLASPHYVRHMANTWRTVMGPSAPSSHAVFRSWLETRVRENAPYDTMVRELLTAPMYNFVYGYNRNIIINPNGNLLLLNPNARINDNPFVVNANPNIKPNPNPFKVKLTPNGAVRVAAAPSQVVAAGPSPGAFFFEANEYKPENLAASTARRFLGVRLECAQCHDHPTSGWTRKQFWEFAAFYSGVRSPATNLYLATNMNNSGVFQVAIQAPQAGPATGRAITIPGTNKVVDARFPDGKSPEWKDNADSRQALAAWVTAPSNSFFARTAANRIWAHFFGIGIIDPIDDEPTEDNPASHPELLAELTAQFVANKFDVKHLIRAITASKAYQRSSAASHERQNQPRLFARMAVKGLTPEQLYDSLAQAAGFVEPSSHPWGADVPNTPRGDFLILFKNHDRVTETHTSILQVLTLMNGRLVTDATSLAGSEKILMGAATTADKIETLYLTTLSRLPKAHEAARMLDYVEGQPDVRAALGDVFWSLLNSSEFRFNH